MIWIIHGVAYHGVLMKLILRTILIEFFSYIYSWGGLTDNLAALDDDAAKHWVERHVPNCRPHKLHTLPHVKPIILYSFLTDEDAICTVAAISSSKNFGGKKIQIP